MRFLRSWSLATLALLFCSFIEPSLANEFHAVAIYEPDNGIAKVSLDRPGQDVILFLESHVPTSWKIELSEGTTIERVILAGASTVDVLDNDIVVEGTSARLGYLIDAFEYRRGIRELYAEVQLDLASFSGSYRAPTQFEISKVQDDERLLHQYPFGVPADTLPRLEFPALRTTVSPPTFGQFSLSGPVLRTQIPIDSERALFDIVLDPNRGEYYGYSRTPYQLSFDGDRFLLGSEVELDDDVPKLRWPVGMTFDARRDRLLLASLAGEGHLYSYSPALDDWQLLTDLNDIDLTAIEYDEQNDILFGLEASHRDNGRLHRFDPENGSLVSSWKLADPIFPGLLGSHERTGTQLIAVDDKLVLMLEPSLSGSVGYTFLLDPSTEQILRVVPEPSSSSWPVLLCVLSLLAWRGRCHCFVVSEALHERT